MIRNVLVTLCVSALFSLDLHNIIVCFSLVVCFFLGSGGRNTIKRRGGDSPCPPLYHNFSVPENYDAMSLRLDTVQASKFARFLMDHRSRKLFALCILFHLDFATTRTTKTTHQEKCGASFYPPGCRHLPLHCC